MVDTAFTEKRGARPMSSGVHRVAIVITDGRSQDNVTEPALDARRSNVLIFAVGVTDHVLESELIQIAGSRERTFIVEQFTDLNTRLRSLIQKTLCPQKTPTTPTKAPGCDPNDLDACDRTRNEICAKLPGGGFGCSCPTEFERHPKTGVCGELFSS
uniref:VWFA domain-containing protein n=1 Tax=Romanomermis culicivorax TaxID=13658 RepID=A0A915K1N4_ROMCU